MQCLWRYVHEYQLTAAWTAYGVGVQAPALQEPKDSGQQCLVPPAHAPGHVSSNQHQTGTIERVPCSPGAQEAAVGSAAGLGLPHLMLAHRQRVVPAARHLQM